VNVLKPVLTELLAKGRRTTGSQPWLGIDTESVRGSLVVTDVRRNSPAERAGMREGDIVAGVAGERVAGQADFYRKLRRIGPAGSVVPLRLVRGGEVRDVTVKSMDAGDALYKPTGI
jgi:S1-C subfamily serine protease